MDINENSIRERAHWLWQQAGSPDGEDLAFWLDAERSLVEEGNGGEFRLYQDEERNTNPNAFSPTPWGANS